MTDVDAMTRRLRSRIAELEPVLLSTSHEIHQRPELQYQEHETAARLCELIRRHAPDARLELGSGGLETAFRASEGDPKSGPSIAFVAEYDALPDVGHGCGHNIIGTAAVGAFLAASKLVNELGGRVEVIGTPAEEGGGGKVLMLEGGVFSDVDLTIQMHPSWETYLCPPMLGMESIRCTFEGIAAHAGQAPFQGRSALAGVIQMFNAVDAMRHHVHPLSRIHGIITEGGKKPSVIPDTARCHFFVRAPDAGSQQDLGDRVRNCARGAVIATDTEVSFDKPEFPAYQPFLPSPSLGRVFSEATAAEGFDPIELDVPLLSASNDIGNVSRRLPATMMMFGISGGKRIPHHSREFEAAAASEKGDQALLGSAAAMAATAARVLLQPDVASSAKAELVALLDAEKV
ncbi:MAG: amidohydrolase [Acidimicrobiia bacterium]